MDDFLENYSFLCFKDFERIILKEEDDYRACIYYALIFDNWPFSTMKCKHWLKILKKCSKVIENFYDTYFKSGFQFKEFETNDKILITCICNLIQRIYCFSEDPIPFKNVDKLLKIALCFDVDISVTALKTLYMIGDVPNLSKSPVQYSILFKLAELDVTLFEMFPSVRDKTFSPIIFQNHGNYNDTFHKLLEEVSQSDLYISFIKSRHPSKNTYFTILKQSSIIILFQNLDGDEFYHRLSLTYSILELESDRNNVKNYTYNDKTTLSTNHYTTELKNSCFVKIIENFLSTNSNLGSKCSKDNKDFNRSLILRHLYYKNDLDVELKYSFERYLVFCTGYDSSNIYLIYILELNKSTGYFYTALENALKYPSFDKHAIIALMDFLVGTDYTQIINKEIIVRLVFQYLDTKPNDILKTFMLALYNYIKESDEFCTYVLDNNITCLLREYLDKNRHGADFGMNNAVLDILFYLYKKQNTRLEPFEESKFLKFCIESFTTSHLHVATKCLKIVTYFANSDPLSIEKLIIAGIDNIFDDLYMLLSVDEQLGVGLINLLDALSLNKDYGKNLRKRKVFTKILDKFSLYNTVTEDSFDLSLVEHLSIILRHHPEYVDEYLMFQSDSLKQLAKTCRKLTIMEGDIENVTKYLQSFKKYIQHVNIKQTVDASKTLNAELVNIYCSICFLRSQQKTSFVTVLQSFVPVFKLLNDERKTLEMMVAQVKRVVDDLQGPIKRCYYHSAPTVKESLSYDEKLIIALIQGERFLSLISAIINVNFHCSHKDQDLFKDIISSSVSLFTLTLDLNSDIYDRDILKRSFISAYLCIFTKGNKNVTSSNDINIHCAMICVNLVYNLRFAVEEFGVNRSFVRIVFIVLFLNKILPYLNDMEDDKDRTKKLKLNEKQQEIRTLLRLGPSKALDMWLKVLGHILEGFNQDVFEEFCGWLDTNSTLLDNKKLVKLNLIEQMQLCPSYNLTKKSRKVLLNFIKNIEADNNEYKKMILDLLRKFYKEKMGPEDETENEIIITIMRKNYFTGCGIKCSLLLQDLDFIIENIKNENYDIFVHNITSDTLDYIVFILNYHFNEDKMSSLLKTTFEVLTFVTKLFDPAKIISFVKKCRERGLFMDAYDFENNFGIKERSIMEDKNHHLQINPSKLYRVFVNKLNKSEGLQGEQDLSFLICCSKYFEVRLSKFGLMSDIHIFNLIISSCSLENMQNTMLVMHYIFATPQDLLDLKRKILDTRYTTSFYGIDEEEYDYFPLVYRNPDLIFATDKFQIREEEFDVVITKDIVEVESILFRILMVEALYDSNLLFVLSEIIFNYPRYITHINILYLQHIIHLYLGKDLKYLRCKTQQGRAKRLFEFLSVCFHTLDDVFIDMLSEYVKSTLLKNHIGELCNIIFILCNISNPLITLSSGIEQQDKDKRLYIGLQKLLNNGVVNQLLAVISNLNGEDLPNLKELIRNSESLIHDLGIKNFHSFIIHNRFDTFANFQSPEFTNNAFDDLNKNSEHLLNVALSFVYNVIYMSYQKEVEESGILDVDLSDEEVDSNYDLDEEDMLYEEENESDNITTSSEYDCSHEYEDEGIDDYEEADEEDPGSSQDKGIEIMDELSNDTSLIIRSAYLRYETDFKALDEENKKLVFEHISKLLGDIQISKNHVIEENTSSASTESYYEEIDHTNLSEDGSIPESSESTIGVIEGFTPDKNPIEINQLNDTELDVYVSELSEQRKSTNIDYYPIDKEFLDRLEPRCRQVFVYYEGVLKDFYGSTRVFLPEIKSKEKGIAEINLNIEKDTIVSFIECFLQDKLIHKLQVHNVLKLMSLCTKLRIDITLYLMLKIIHKVEALDKENAVSNVPLFEKLRKCIDIFRFMISKNKFESSNTTFIKSLFGLLKYKEVSIKVLTLINELQFEYDGLLNEQRNFIDNNLDIINLYTVKTTIILPLLSIAELWIDKRTAKCLNNIINGFKGEVYNTLVSEIISKLSIELLYILHGEECKMSNRYIEKQEIIYNTVLIFSMCFSSLYESCRNCYKDFLEIFFTNLGIEYRNIEDIDTKYVFNLTQSNLDIIKNINNLTNNRMLYEDLENCLLLISTFEGLISDKLEKIIFICQEQSSHADRVFTSELFNVYFFVFSTYEKFLNFYFIFSNDNEHKITIYTTYESLKNNLMQFLESNIQEVNAIFSSESDLFKSNIKFLSRFNIINFTNKNNYFRAKIQEMNLYKDGTYTVNIHKNNILGDSLFQIMNKHPKEFKSKKLQIKFSGEEGVDFGGLTREWCDLLIKSILNPDLGLFVYTSDKKTTVLPYRNSNINSDHLLYFKFIGRVLAKAIIDRLTLDLQIDRSAYKYFLGKKCDLADLENIDPQFYNSLIWMKNNSIENIVFQSFSTEYCEFGEVQIVDLKPNGRNIPVTDENKREYIELITEYKLFKGIEVQLNALKQGLYEIIDRDMLSIFNENEFELLINGIPDINVDDWMNNTVYYGYKNNSPNIIWFWKAVKSFTSEERAKLLQFCTGSSRVPYEGFSHLQGNNGPQKFSIHKTSHDNVRLPSAHTCFNQLDLPEYSSFVELRKSIVYAINECSEGFGLI